MYVSFSQGDYVEASFTNQIDYYINKVVGVFLSNMKRGRPRVSKTAEGISSDLSAESSNLFAVLHSSLA